MPFLPSGRIIVISNADKLKPFDHLPLGPAIQFSEAEHNVDFELGEGNGYDEFLEHAVLLSRYGEVWDGGKGFTIKQMMNLDAETARYSRTCTQQELLDEMHEDTMRYFLEQGITRDDIVRRLEYGYYEDTLTTCCGMPGCGSTHGLIRGGKCDALFEVSAGSLVSVEFFPFKIVG